MRIKVAEVRLEPLTRRKKSVFSLPMVQQSESPQRVPPHRPVVGVARLAAGEAREGRSAGIGWARPAVQGPGSVGWFSGLVEKPVARGHGECTVGTRVGGTAPTSAPLAGLCRVGTARGARCV